MRLYFIRHGQSENNVLWFKNKSPQGRVEDPNLTDLGWQQAHAAGRFLSSLKSDYDENTFGLNGRGLTHLYSSLMQRAVQTAMAISEETGLPVHAWLDLHEGGGIYQDDFENGRKIGRPGNNRPFFETHYPNLVLPEELGTEGWWNRSYEDRHELPERARRMVRTLLDRHGSTDDWVAVVSHGDFYQRVLAILLQLPLRDFHVDYPERTTVFDLSQGHRHKVEGLPENTWFLLNNAAITRIDINGDYLLVAYTNRHDFMPPEMVT